MSTIASHNPIGLLEHIPHALGFTPVDAVVIVAPLPSHTVAVEHFSLNAPFDPHHLVANLAAVNATRAFIVVYAPSPYMGDDVVSAAVAALHAAGIDIADIILSSHDEWVAAIGTHPDTGEHGGVLPTEPARLSGRAPVDTDVRDEVAYLVNTMAADLAEAPGAALEAHFDEAVSLLLDFDPDADLPTPAETAVLATAAWHTDLTAIAVKFITETPVGHLKLWRWVARLAPGRHRAPAALLCACAAWHAGQAALACDAAHLATVAAPGWPAARLLRDRLALGEPPYLSTVA